MSLIAALYTDVSYFAGVICVVVILYIHMYMVWHGTVWQGVVRCGKVWQGVVWCGMVWYGVAWCGIAWCGVAWHVYVPTCICHSHVHSSGWLIVSLYRYILSSFNFFLSSSLFLLPSLPSSDVSEEFYDADEGLDHQPATTSISSQLADSESDPSDIEEDPEYVEHDDVSSRSRD